MHRSRILAAILPPVGALLLAVILAGPFFLAHRPAVPNTHDLDTHLATLEEFDKGVRAGSWYPRWLAGFDYGYGLPWLNYYQPGFFYLAEPFLVLFKNSLRAMLAVSLLTLAGSGVAFYFFAHLFYGRLPAAAGAMFYMVAPYHLVDLYQRGAMPEFAGFLFVPLIFHAAYRLGDQGKPRQYALFGLAYGLYLFTHFAVGYLLTPILAVYVVLWAIAARTWRIAARVAGGGVLGLLLSAIYWLPSALESGLVDEYWSTTFKYHESYMPLYPAKDQMAGLLNQCFGGVTLLLLLAMVVLGLLRVRMPKSSGRSGKKPYLDPEAERDAAHRRQTRLLLAGGAASVFMITELSFFISRLIPKIEIVQFPWRWMLIISFFAAVAVAAVFDRLRLSTSSKRRRWACGVAVAAVLAWNLWISGRSSVEWALESPDMVRAPTHVDGIFYPHGALPPYQLYNTPNAVMMSGRGDARVLDWGPLRRRVQVNVEQAGLLRLRTYNFAGWTARINGSPAEIQSDLQGAQSFDLQPGRYDVEVVWGGTATRTAGALISGLALLLAAGLLLVDLWARLRRRTLSS